ncbi:MAG: glutaminyl-peptide cyclotransferase [Atribacterota bacterium]|nr:glutaminyl-peptide cyclotransferase [Atribacterota bacterium]
MSIQSGKFFLIIFIIVLISPVLTSFAIFFVDSSPVLQYEIIESYPHDTAAFTQGLILNGDFLYEGTGLYGESSIRKVELETGKVLQQYNLPDKFFGEGITIFNNRIYQLTWKKQTGFIYDLETFRLLDVFIYSHEGWGITHNGEYLIISDGTSVLRFIDPLKLKEVKQINVSDSDTPVDRLNELEYINGYIYANIWQTDIIAIIDPETGKVNSWLDLSGILKDVKTNEKIDVLNGIAFDSERGHLLITGKLWPKIFRIKISEN